MGTNEEQKVKIRFKFRSGEEFEAEGSPEFIEKQRADFLHLIGKEKKRSSFAPFQPTTEIPAAAPASAESVATAAIPVFTPSPNTSETESVPARQPVFTNEVFSVPASLRRHTSDRSYAFPNNSGASQNTSQEKYIVPTNTSRDEIRLWEEITKTEEDLVVLRRKSRLLGSDTAALLLLGAAKMLFKAPQYGALTLAKSLVKSGYGGGRLDRILAGEMKRGNVKAFGSKRSRAYALSDEGFARAFVLAGKLAEEWR